MSSHCYDRNWTINDPMPEGLLDDIAGCVSMNMKVKPGAFAVFGHADGINYWLWNMFLGEKDHDKRVTAIEVAAKTAPDPEKFKQISLHVLEQIEKEEA